MNRSARVSGSPRSKPISLLDRPHAEARALLATGAPVFLCVNPVEYHGPHLSLHNDAIVSKALATAMHARLRIAHPEWPLLYGGDLEVGVEPASGPGSRHTSFAIARSLIREACRALVELGVERVVVLTFHGSPLHNLAIESGLRLLERSGVRAIAPMPLLLEQLVTLDPERLRALDVEDAFATVVDEDERRAVRDGLALDFHAGFFETSVALHCAPGSVSAAFRKLPPCPVFRADPRMLAVARVARAAGRTRLADELGFVAHGLGWYALRPFPGYTGRPHLASAEAGRVLVERIVERFVAATDDVFAGRAARPRPVLEWIAAASLGGRVGAVHVPTEAVVAEGDAYAWSADGRESPSRSEADALG
ncbi:MAG: creatininase family protein [Deltaproteobacteria bacterium]|nr:creatininase family protein [Deltaproteobacteria bacterium]